MTSNPPNTAPLVRALTGGQIAAGALQTFPACINAKQVLDAQDIAALAEASLDPRGVVMPVFPARNWLPANERVSAALGRAQHALRDLDDQRAIVRSVDIVSGSLLIRLHRAPHPETVKDVHQVRLGRDWVNCGSFGEGDLQVLLEWPL